MRAGRILFVLLVGGACFGAGAGAGSTRAGTLGLVPDPDPERHAQLERVVRLAAGSDLEVVVGRGESHWQGATEILRQLLDDESVDVLLAPPDRALAHLVAQVATRRHVPAIELSPRSSQLATTAVTAGSFWLITCRSPTEPPAELQRELGRAPDRTEIAVWTAVAAARSLLHDHDFEAGRATSRWRDLLPPACRETPTTHTP